MLDRGTFRRLCLARDVPRENSFPIHRIAIQTGMSPFHFIRRFEALFGATPHQFRVLLAQGGLTVTEVCMEAGFSSLGSFSALIARRIGQPPSRFQRRAASDSDPPLDFFSSLPARIAIVIPGARQTPVC